MLPENGADTAAVAATVRSVVGDRAEVLTGERRGLAELPGTLSSQRTVVILAAIFGSSVVLIVMFGVASTLGLSLQQRTREMALLRAVGSTPQQLRRMILIETAVLSVASVLLALYPGYLLGRLLFGVLTSSGVVSSAIVYHMRLDADGRRCRRHGSRRGRGHPLRGPSSRPHRTRRRPGRIRRSAPAGSACRGC